MLNLSLIRHAESEMNNKEDLIGGRSNHAKLSDAGEEQARLLGERLKSEGVRFDKIHCSVAVRAQETARIALETAGHRSDQLIVSEDLCELDQGDWQNCKRDEVYTPEIMAQINTDCWNFTPPGGESQKMVEERMLRWLSEEIIPADGANCKAAIFGHGMAFKCLLRGILGSSPGMTYKIDLGNTSITRLAYTKRGWHLLAVNDTAHLHGVEQKTHIYLKS